MDPCSEAVVIKTRCPPTDCSEEFVRDYRCPPTEKLDGDGIIFLDEYEIPCDIGDCFFSLNNDT